MNIYAMSDLHGEIDLFNESLNLVDLSGDNKLILLGDYISINIANYDILYFIKEFQEKYKDQVICLSGNHEYMLLEDIQSKANSFNDTAIINWLRGLPYYYTTDKHIFVHAGVDEDAGEYWKWGSEDYYFCNKYPHTTGKFIKDIISGHVSTSEIAADPNYHKVYWDKHSHFFIDGSVHVSKTIPVLKYDTISGKYSSFEKIKQNDGSFVWQEYTINK